MKVRSDLKEIIIDGVFNLKEAVRETDFSVLAEMATVIAAGFMVGRKLLICGNGGSAADAQHFAAELCGRFERERMGYPAIALTTDTSVLTAVGNDYGYGEVFRRQIDVLGKPADRLVAISTSGMSENIIHALQAAREIGMPTMLLTGKRWLKYPHKDRTVDDMVFVVEEERTSRIQEVHGFAIHLLCEMIDRLMEEVR